MLNRAWCFVWQCLTEGTDTASGSPDIENNHKLTKASTSAQKTKQLNSKQFLSRNQFHRDCLSMVRFWFRERLNSQNGRNILIRSVEYANWNIQSVHPIGTLKMFTRIFIHVQMFSQFSTVSCSSRLFRLTNGLRACAQGSVLFSPRMYIIFEILPQHEMAPSQNVIKFFFIFKSLW